MPFEAKNTMMLQLSEPNIYFHHSLFIFGMSRVSFHYHDLMVVVLPVHDQSHLSERSSENDSMKGIWKTLIFEREMGKTYKFKVGGCTCTYIPLLIRRTKSSPSIGGTIFTWFGHPRFTTHGRLPWPHAFRTSGPLQCCRHNLCREWYSSYTLKYANQFNRGQKLKVDTKKFNKCIDGALKAIPATSLYHICLYMQLPSCCKGKIAGEQNAHRNSKAFVVCVSIALLLLFHLTMHCSPYKHK